jgi:hypothetical protein
LKQIIVRRVLQKKGHCGPTTLEMLFSFYGLAVSQDAIVQAANLFETIQRSGSRIDQLDEAVQKLAPDYTLLAKYNSSIEDIALLTGEFELPVGVEWQGTFIDQEGTFFDEGHYSVITSVDQLAAELNIVDPEERSALREGKISVADFERRWWEENDVPMLNDPTKTEIIRNDRLIFVLIIKSCSAPLRDFGLQPVSLMLLHDNSVPRGLL